MQETKNSATTSNGNSGSNLKTDLIIIFSLMIIHTMFWWLFEFYSNKLYCFVIGTLFVLSFAYSLDYFGPKGKNIFKAIILGAYPTILAGLLPKYSFFAMCLNFMSFWTVTSTLSIEEISMFVPSNAFGWIGCYVYHQYLKVPEACQDNDDGNPKYIKVFFDDSLLFYQLVLGLVVCFAMSKMVFQQKQKQIDFRTSYEQKLLTLNKELEVANQKLFQTNKELQAALQEKENFILRFSHEIRNPLNSLLGNVDLCQEFAENEESKQMLKEANVSGEILLQLLNNVLDTAKVSAGRLDISIHCQNIRDFLERAWVVCSEIIRKKRLYGSLSVDVNVPEKIEFDTHRLMQILINVVSNASKFTEHGYVKVFVEFEEGSEIKSEVMKPRHTDSIEKAEENGRTLAEELNQEEFNETPMRNYEILSSTKKRFAAVGDSSMKLNRGSIGMKPPFETGFKPLEYHLSNANGSNALSASPRDGYLRLEIIDTGCGIKKKDLDLIFAKFSQAHEESSKRQIGTGLGLWITKEIVELMKGKIEMFSVPNYGTAFVIMLKCKASEPSQPILQPQITMSPDPSRMIKRAMVVEDILYNQEINYKFLQKCGVEHIDVANNGKEALDLYIQKGEDYFDLILMDIDMPVMNGKDATKKIRQHEAGNRWNPTAVVFLTAYSEAKMQRELLDPEGEYKADGFLSKPASQEIIRRTISEQVSKFAVKRKKIIGVDHLNVDPKLKDHPVLLIDDDPYNLSVVSKMLSRCGFKPLEALNGKEALELYNKHCREIILVLTDCEMPIMDGIRVTQEILKKHKKGLSNQKLVVYGITGHVGAEYKTKCLDAGMKDVLEKPITFDKLKKLLLYDNDVGPFMR